MKNKNCENGQIIANQENCGNYRDSCKHIRECSFVVEPVPITCSFSKGHESPDCPDHQRIEKIRENYLSEMKAKEEPTTKAEQNTNVDSLHVAA